MPESTPSLADRLSHFLRDPGYRPLKAHELSRDPRFGASTREVRAALRELEDSGRAVKLRGNRWAPAPESTAGVTGRLIIAFSGYGIVITDPPEPEEYFIPPSEIGSCMDGDRVAVAPSGRKAREGEKQEARIVRVVERRIRTVAGKFAHAQFYPYLIPGDPRMRATLHVRDSAIDLAAIPEGDIVVMDLDPPAPPDRSQTGVIREHLGAPGDPGVDMKMLMANRGIVTAFEPEVTEAARAISPTLADRDREGRRDLRDALIFTIDPADAKDYDDAVSLTRDGDHWVLGVHIADVSHFVEPGGDIDLEARARGNSVYMIDRFVPMLPKYLTSDVCSLRAGVDRVTYSVSMRLDAEGAMVSAETFRSVIHSKACLHYEQVQAFLDGGPDTNIPEALHATLRDMDALAVKVRRRRMAAGAIDLALPEVECTLDADGNPVALKRRGAAEAYHLIEEFMLLANCAVAARIRDAGVPGVYRIHEEPSEDQWAQMALDVRNLGIGREVTNRDGIHEVCRMVRGTPQEYAVNLAMLKNFKRAVYAAQCQPHFGLAFDCYTHFTSPIRRYPDLVVHRILDALDTGKPPPYRSRELDALCLHATETERNAQAAEEESLEIKRLQYYRNAIRKGEIGPYPALVVGVASRGLIVELVESLQRGFVPLHGVAGAQRAERDQGRVYGAKSKILHAVGQVMEVALVRVDEAKRQVDFLPWNQRGVDPGGRKGRRASRRGPSGPPRRGGRRR